MNSIKKNETPKEFSFGNQLIRVDKVDGNPWFVAKDLCDYLELTDVNKSLERLDDDEKLTRKVFVSGQNRSMWFVNESGMYALIIRSSKPKAREFRKWITNEVLPSIRKTGAYKVKRRWRQRPLLVSDPPEKRKSDYPIDRGGLWDLFYRELQTYTTFSDIYDACVHTKKKRAYVLEVLRGRKMSWPVLGFLTDRANVNKVHGIEGHLPISITKPDSMREQKTNLMEKLICTRTPQELEEERQKPINEQFTISYPFL